LVHEELETLEVTFIKGAATSSLLDAVSLPSLKNLGLHYLGKENVPLLPVISLVSRSSASSSLHKLSLTRTVFAEEDLIRCLEVLPSLVELCLCVRELDHPIVGVGFNLSEREGLSERFVYGLFHCQDVREPLLPQLRKFTYEGFVSNSCSIEHVTVAMEKVRDGLAGACDYFYGADIDDDGRGRDEFGSVERGEYADLSGSLRLYFTTERLESSLTGGPVIYLALAYVIYGHSYVPP
jgi:hypothetical protein